MRRTVKVKAGEFQQFSEKSQFATGKSCVNGCQYMGDYGCVHETWGLSGMGKHINHEMVPSTIQNW